MADPIQVFVFGDQTFDASELMFRLLHTHDDMMLSSFLDSSYRTLKQEVSNLKDEQRSSCPRFSKLAELLPYWRNGTLNPALDQAMTCISQIGTFLRVSAAPDILNDLLATTELSQAVKVELPITAPYHAPHLYTSENINSIVYDVGEAHSSIIIPIISSTGEVIKSATFRDALRISVEACLQHTIRSDLIVTGLAAHIQHEGEFVIRHIAATSDGLGPAIQSALGPSSKRVDIAQDHGKSIRNPLLLPRSKSKIAIISMSGRFPQAPSMEAFWHVLKNGIDTHELALASRWNCRTHVGDISLKELPKNTSGTGFGCWLHDAAQFDARFFNMSPREAPQVDPAQRIALLTASEALEQAGIVPGRTSSTQKDRVGVYFGSTSNDWMETNSAQNIDTYFIPGGNRAFIPGRINYHFKFSGPSYTIDTACSSSFTALHLACNALWKGEIDMAIVGGTNVLTNPDMTAGLDRGHFLSRTGNCKTFDDTADGYCRGEAVATAVLKRLDDAIIDKDPVQACILAIATNHSAEADSITRPHVGAQQALFESVLADAGIKPTDISYCEMHGTGTQAGDAGETTSVLQSLAPDQPATAIRKKHETLYIGAAKSNIGHGEAAAGVTSLAKVLLMLKKSIIPPHCGIKTKINHKLPDLVSRNVCINTSAISWPRPAQCKRKVLLNNFSAAGGNTALVLEDAPELLIDNSPDARLHHLIAVTAKTPAALDNNTKNLLHWLSGLHDSSKLALARLSYTTTARRTHHSHRIMIKASDLGSLKIGLKKALDDREGSSRLKGAPRYIFSFTGQGAQFAGMGAELFLHIKSFRADICRYDQICQQLHLPSIQQLFQGTASFDAATPTMIQLATVCFQMALYRMWVSFGVTPIAVVGHSLGEYAALYAASVLTQADVINLVGQRAQLLERHCEPGSHTMVAVRANAVELEAALGLPNTTYEFSCHNGNNSVVLGGTKAQIEAILPTLQRSRMSHKVLDVPYAYHTSQVDPILASLQRVAEGTRFRKPNIPVISPAYGKVLSRKEDFGSKFVIQHCRHKVDMVGALQSARNLNFLDEKMIGIELGPQPIVISMVKELTGPNFRTFASSCIDRSALDLLATSLSSFYTAGADINWMLYHADFLSCQVVLDLPAYSWDLKDYWIQYVHDWSLRKGEPPLIVDSTSLESTCIHKVVTNSLSAAGGELLLEADLSRPDLHPLVQGHKVYGVPLCTPSVYADMALTIGEYAKRFAKPSKSTYGVEVADMNIQSALVANSDGSAQLLHINASFDSEKSSLYCTFSSVDADGKLKEQHSNCLVRLFDVETIRTALGVTAPNITLRISALQDQLRNFGNTFRYSKGMIYKMVGQLADFDPKYRALEEITLDSDTLEATGRVNFTKVLTEGKFHTNPAYIDALSQLGGFVMNGNEGVDLDKELFVNHGWGSLKLIEKIDPNKVYTTHVKMIEGKEKLWTGDITIMDGDVVIGIFGGVALQGVPKRLMSYIVSAASKRTNDPGLSISKGSVAHKASVVTPVRDVIQKMAEQSIILQKPAEDKSIFTAIEIISQESGIVVSELTDDTRFDDIGVDSLLGLMVSSRIRDELGLDIDSTSFLELRTVRDFKIHLRDLNGATEELTAITETLETGVPPTVVPTLFNAAPENISSVWISVLTIISEESGINAIELTADTNFSDIGIDSLLSLVIVSRMRDELGLDVPDQSLFLDFPILESLKIRIIGGSESLSSDSETSSSDILTDNSSHGLSPSKAHPVTQPSDYFCSQTDVVQPLHISSCQFCRPQLQNPGNMKDRSLSEIINSYIESVRRHQSHGPYHLAGWSAGGILAYAVAQNLISTGEEVATLTLIDSPPPNDGLDRLPRRFFDHCSAVGIFGEEMSAINSMKERSKLPDWLMPHFEATIELLHDYRAPPFVQSIDSPKRVTVIWAGDCAFGGKYALFPPASMEGEDTEGMKFLTEQRTDFGPGKWADLFPGNHIDVYVVEGEHHFSMMRGKGGEQIGRMLRKALDITF
ncbi:hypothetical protein GQ44DRAFT_747268 [Phaeosphaeriaceae sp. PMI808]|nr:hypothetical protein GQ44DRAFT_747268 [Phaeosphaeriaceae sp. PMI808]